MTCRFEELILRADFTKESGLYEKLEETLNFRRPVGSIMDHRISDDEMEKLSAAGAVDFTLLKPGTKMP